MRSNYCQLECGCPGIAWLLAFAEFGLNRKALEAVKSSSSVLTIITNITILTIITNITIITIIFHQHHIFISGIVHLMQLFTRIFCTANITINLHTIHTFDCHQPYVGANHIIIISQIGADEGGGSVKFLSLFYSTAGPCLTCQK